MYFNLAQKGADCKTYGTAILKEMDDGRLGVTLSGKQDGGFSRILQFPVSNADVGYPDAVGQFPSLVAGPLRQLDRIGAAACPEASFININM